jgi:predicted nucleotidyltransferase component of viral defense system
MLKGKGLLSAGQRRFLRLFSKTPDSTHFYLTGGTALAEFYLGHRYSFDLDLFTGEPDLLAPFCRVLETLARKRRHPLQVIRRFETFVEYLVPKRARVPNPAGGG